MLDRVLRFVIEHVLIFKHMCYVTLKWRPEKGLTEQFLSKKKYQFNVEMIHTKLYKCKALQIWLKHFFE